MKLGEVTIALEPESKALLEGLTKIGQRSEEHWRAAIEAKLESAMHRGLIFRTQYQPLVEHLFGPPADDTRPIAERHLIDEWNVEHFPHFTLVQTHHECPEFLADLIKLWPDKKVVWQSFADAEADK